MLDFDQAWTYRIYALLNPGKLPGEYRSSAIIPSGTSVVLGYRRIEDKLKPETREVLRPYFVRPSDSPSIYDEDIVSSAESPVFGREKVEPPFRMAALIPSFGSLSARADSLQETRRPETQRFKSARTEGTPIEVWSSKSVQSARSALDLITGHEMYKKFEGLMGLGPLSDAREAYPDGTPNDGGGGDLDIYLIPDRTKSPSLAGAAGLCVPTGDARKTPCFILIREGLTGKSLAATLAHELFHAFQFAIDSEEQTWWMESTAVWAEDFIGPDWDTEQEYLPEAFDLEKYMLKPLASDAGLHEYGIYLFAYYLSTKFGQEVIGRIWKDCENKDVLEAVEAAFGAGGLGEGFKEFARLTMDVEPEKGIFIDVSGPIELYSQHYDQLFELEKGQKETRVEVSLDPLSAVYVRLYNFLDAKETPHVRFDLSRVAQNPDLTLQAVIDPGDKNTKEDWTGLKEKVFCLNWEEERFSVIELVVSSKSRKEAHSSGFVVTADDKGCSERPNGTIVYKHRSNWEDTATNASGSVTNRGEFIAEASIQVNLKYSHSYRESDYYVQESARGAYSFRYRNDVIINGRIAPQISPRSERAGELQSISVSLVVNRKDSSYNLDIGFGSDDTGNTWELFGLNTTLTGSIEGMAVTGVHHVQGEQHWIQDPHSLFPSKPGDSWTWNILLPPRKKSP